MGLGILGANAPGTTAGQAIGQGGLLGINNYQQMLAQQQRLAVLAEEEKRRQRETEIAEDQRKRQLAAMELIRKQDPQFAALMEAAPNAVPAYAGSLYRSPTEAPSNVREWLYFSRLPHEQQQMYMAMKRAGQVVDRGSEYVVLDPTAGYSPQAVVQKDLPPEQQPAIKGAQAEASAAGQVRGKSGAEAEMGLGQALAEAQNAISVIDQMISHPGLEYAVGASSMLPIVPGTPAADFDALAQQLGGKAFLQAFDSLKGGGHITEIEGEKATAAMARLSRAQTEAGYKSSLRELKNIWQAGMARARSKARQSQARQQGGNFSGFRIIEDQ